MSVKENVVPVPARTAATVAWSAFAALALGQLLVDVDDVVLNIALPSVARDTGLTASLVPWAVNAYLLCFGGLLLLGGRLADRAGHRAVLLAGVGVFIVASLLGGIAGSPAQVIGARAGQGLAAALLAPSAMSLLVHTFPDPRERSRALGLWGAVTGMGAVIGLVIGGVVTEYLGWRWIFMGNAVVAVVVGLSVLVLLPGGTGDRSVRIEPWGALLAVVAAVSLVWGLHGTLEHGWLSVHTAVWLALAMLALLGCVLMARGGRAPLVPSSLLRNRAVVVADLCGALVGAALLGTFYFVSLHLQQVLGYSPMQAAGSYLPLVAGLVLAAGVGSGVLPRTGARPMLVLGMTCCAAGLFLLALLGVEDHRSAFVTSLLPGLLVSGLGLGLAFVALTVTAVPGGEDSTDGGAASGLYNTALQIGGALGIAVLATTATSRMQSLVADGVPMLRAVTEGRDLALLVAAGLLLAGVAVAWRMPREAGKAADGSGRDAG